MINGKVLGSTVRKYRTEVYVALGIYVGNAAKPHPRSLIVLATFVNVWKYEALMHIMLSSSSNEVVSVATALSVKSPQGY